MTQFSRKRRLMLGAGLAAVAIGTIAYKPIAQRFKRPSTTETLLSSVVDTVVPADEFAGAIDLKLDQKLLNLMNSNENQRTRFASLADAIRKKSLTEHHTDFETLNLNIREALLNGIVDNRDAKIIRRSLLRLRSNILQWYYSTEQGHQSLGYQLPSNYPAYKKR